GRAAAAPGRSDPSCPNLSSYCGRNLTAMGRTVSGVAAHRQRSPERRGTAMDFKLELVALPVTDVDRAKAFYVDQVGFNADQDHTVSEEIRFVQLTPPGSACSIAFGRGIVDSAPGS